MADQSWPADKVRRRKVASLLPYAKNARTHSEEQVAQLARSIEEFGFTMPVLVDEGGTIIAGHGRVLAAQLLGLSTIPVMVARGWSEVQRRAYVIADNKLTLNAGWDDSLLRAEMTDLQGMGFDLGLLGFGPEEAAALLVDKTAGLTDPDDAPAAPVNPVTRPGDLWALGAHRVLCGDATSEEDVQRLHGGSLADLCFTSPPYAQQRDYDTGGITDWDALMRGAFDNLQMTLAGQVLVNLGLVHRDGEWQPYWEGWIEWMRGQGWRRFGWYVWDQGSGLPGDWNGRLAPSFEFIFHFNRERRSALKSTAKLASSGPMGSNIRTRAGRNAPRSSICLDTRKVADNVVRVNRNSSHGTGHPATFPVGLPESIIKSWPGVVCDPFLGSGTTVIAAEMEGRSCLGLEISPAYCDVIVKRWQGFTGPSGSAPRKSETAPAPMMSQSPRSESAGKSKGYPHEGPEAKADGDAPAARHHERHAAQGAA